MEIATVGFTQTSAERFFERLKLARIERIVDIRLHNVSQLAGFAKANDLQYFARVICGATYEHDTRLAPTDELLAAYRKKGATWPWYESQFRALMEERGVPSVIEEAKFENSKTVLLCSEPTPDKCHKRIVAELLGAAWAATVEHL